MNQVEPCLLIPEGCDERKLSAIECRDAIRLYPHVPPVGAHVEVELEDSIESRRVTKVLFRTHEIPVVWYESQSDEDLHRTIEELHQELDQVRDQRDLVMEEINRLQPGTYEML